MYPQRSQKEKDSMTLKNASTINFKPFIALLLVLMMPALQSCQAVVVKNAAPVELAPAVYEDQFDNEYSIQVGDLLGIKFFENPDLDEEVRVRPDGRISLQLIDEIMVAGMKPSELKKVIGEKYSHILNDYRVSVIVREFMPQKIFVTGEVHTATVVTYNGPLTVLQAIAYAGGFTDTAKEGRVVVIRRLPNTNTRVFQVDIKKVLDGTDVKQDVLLAPYDTVYVP